MEGKSLRQQFLKYVIPSILAQWIFTLYTMVDGIFVAKGVSEVALTAVNIAMPYMMSLFAFSILFAVGTSTVVAILLGEGKIKKANEVFTQNVVLLTVFSIILTIIMMFSLERIALFLGATQTNLHYVLAYLKTIVPFSIVFILSYSFEMLIKTDGYPKRGMIIVTIGSLLNVILDYLMVMRWHMGIEGAALATGIANTVVIILYLFHFCSRRGIIHFQKFKLNLLLVWREFKNGLPSGITELSTALVIFLFNQAVLKFLNEDALVSYTIISYVNSLAIMTMVGISQGYQPLISYYYGKKQEHHCQKLYRYGIIAVVVMSIAFTTICYVGANQIVSWFVSADYQELYQYSVQVLRIFILSFLIAGYNIVISGYFTAIEKPFLATLISLSRSIVMMIFSLLVMTSLFQGAGIWWSPLVSEGVTLIMTIGFVIYDKKQ